MAAELSFLTSREAVFLALAVIYTCLIAVIALTAVFSARPARRKAALTVLSLLLPGRRHLQPVSQGPGRTRTARRRAPPGVPLPEQPLDERR